jgi:hypothetical protein
VGIADVKVPLRVDPRALSVGSIATTDELITRTVKMRKGDGGPLNLSLERAPQGIEVEISEVVPHEEYDVKITMRPPWPMKRRYYKTIKFATGLENSPTFEYRVMGQVRPVVRVVPSRFIFSRETKDAQEKVGRLIWDKGQNGKIVSVKVDDENIAVSLEETEKGEQRIKVAVPAGYTPGRRTCQVTLTTDNLKVGDIQAPLYFTMPRRTRTQQPITRHSVKRQPTQSVNPPTADDGKIETKPGSLKGKTKAEEAPAARPAAGSSKEQPTGKSPTSAEEPAKQGSAKGGSSSGASSSSGSSKGD